MEVHTLVLLLIIPTLRSNIFTDVYIINGNTVNFIFLVNQKLIQQQIKQMQEKNTLTGMIMNSIAGSNEMAYQQEMFWHRQIYEIFESLIQ